jgi:hypothetical protein
MAEYSRDNLYKLKSNASGLMVEIGQCLDNAGIDYYDHIYDYAVRIYELVALSKPTYHDLNKEQL